VEHDEINRPDQHPTPDVQDTADELLDMTDQQEPLSRDERIVKALDTVKVAKDALDRLNELDGDQYKEELTKRRKSQFEVRIAEIEENIAKYRAFLDVRKDIETKLDYGHRIADLEGEATYLRDRLENIDREVATEIEIDKAGMRRTFEDLAWALGRVYDLDEDKCESLSEEELGKILTKRSSWAAETKRSIFYEKEIIKLRHEANAIMAIPTDPDNIYFEDPHFTRRRQDLERIVGNMKVSPTLYSKYEHAQTREQWQEVIDLAAEEGLTRARNHMRSMVDGDIKYVMKDLQKA
jgi:hypothetical protein